MRETVTRDEIMAAVDPARRLSPLRVQLSPDVYRDGREARALEDLQPYVPHEKSLLEYYRTVVQGERLPDLLGKTVKVGPRQFSGIHQIATEIAAELGVVAPDIFVYPDTFYRVGMEGLDSQWVELSSAVAEEFSETELRFVIGTQVARVHCGHFRTEAVIQASLRTATYLDRLPVVGAVGAVEAYGAFLQAAANRWRRIAVYSADGAGFLMCASVKAAVSAIMKLVLNNPKLVAMMDVEHFIAQGAEMERLNQTMMRWTKLDEPIPYGPHRILQLFRYASSSRAKGALAQLARGRVEHAGTR